MLEKNLKKIVALYRYYKTKEVIYYYIYLRKKESIIKEKNQKNIFMDKIECA